MGVKTAAQEHDAWKRSPTRKRGLRFGRALAETLPPAALAVLRNQTGTYLGEDLGDVLRFVVTDWLHQNIDKLPRKLT